MMMNSNFELGAAQVNSMTYEVIVEVGGEIFVMERSVCLNKQNKVNIAYKSEIFKS
ncbi:MAG: hypothetical protein HXY43_08540 [Fischerella sp.]|jgi:hypothetical protein|uniref:hypothetical protein n=1 Tax=Fischerella sp. TaxID=1191 RepID=UPI001826D897|nr:hypothetical protein [Fischerella sp.]NWF59339.1 hypothetical protein [Fischerella sp.]